MPIIRTVNCPNCKAKGELATRCRVCGEPHALEPGAILLCPACCNPMIVGLSGEIRAINDDDMEVLASEDIMELAAVVARMRNARSAWVN